jgi:hypothetical protein
LTDDFALGFEFEPSEDLVVSSLGAVDWHGVIPADPIEVDGEDVEVNGLIGPVAVGLYDADGLIATATVQPDAPAEDGYRWASIDPITLTAGTKYGGMAVFAGDNVYAGLSSSDIEVDGSIVVTRVLVGLTPSLPATMVQDHTWPNSQYAANIGIEACP